MENALIIIGKNIKYNEYLIDYIKRKYLTKVKKIDILQTVEDGDKNLFLTIEEIIQKSDNVLIASNDRSFNISGKILSTLYSDSLVLKNDMLLPSKCNIYEKDSYLIKAENKNINVLKVKEQKKLPNILLQETKGIKFINIFNMDDESCKIFLEPIAENYEIKTQIIKIIEGWNRVKIESLKYGQIYNFIDSAKQLLKGKIIDSDDVLRHITSKLIEKGLKITTAESCTGGLLSSMLIKNSGVSNIINGNLVTYSNKTKEIWLGVEKEILENFGAVSKECVSQMLDGALKTSGADIAIAISGIAGPDGGTKEKPIGTVYIGVKNRKGKNIIEKLFLEGDRIYIQKQSALYAVKLLLNLQDDIFF